MYVCLCFGITEQQVHAHREAGACSPRQIASVCKAGTDCGGCVKRIQALLGRTTDSCARRKAPVTADRAVTAAEPVPAV
ncbi:(2Fe-2S)-binding protein [Streptomyces capparidis]|jgi:bacterioferritin-associated ferredoxin